MAYRRAWAIRGVTVANASGDPVVEWRVMAVEDSPREREKGHVYRTAAQAHAVLGKGIRPTSATVRKRIREAAARRSA